MDTPAAAPKDSGFRSFAEFYQFYLSEHRHPVSRALHYVGTWGAVICLAALAVSGELWWLAGTAICGYSFAWLGHFRFERNKPATFRHPFSGAPVKSVAPTRSGQSSPRPAMSE